MKEIGGYFGLEQLISNEYYKDLIALNSGRNALLYLLKGRKIKKIYIPYFLCESVSNICIKNGYNIEFYNIDSEFKPIFNKNLEDGEYIYVVNYYGQVSRGDIEKLLEKHKRIIVDNTQAFFQKPVEGTDTIYVCRKYFGVPDGAYLYTNCKVDFDLETSASKDKMAHILGRYEGSASQYYSDYQAKEKSFEKEPLSFMSNLTHNILGAIDYKKVYEIRNINYQYLNNKLGSGNKLKLKKVKGPFAYPLYIEDGMKIKKELAKKIYIFQLFGLMC